MTNMIESKTRVSSLGNILLILMIFFSTGTFAHPEPFFLSFTEIDAHRHFKEQSQAASAPGGSEIQSEADVDTDVAAVFSSAGLDVRAFRA